MKQADLCKVLEGLSKASILAALERTPLPYLEGVYRDALRAELDAKWNERAAAAAKMLEYLNAAAAGTPGAYKAYLKSSAHEAQISTRIARLIKIQEANYEDV